MQKKIIKLKIKLTESERTTLSDVHLMSENIHYLYTYLVKEKLICYFKSR